MMRALLVVNPNASATTERTRDIRNVRSPAAVSATRYQTGPLATTPSGWTVRSLSVRSAES